MSYSKGYSNTIFWLKNNKSTSLLWAPIPADLKVLHVINHAMPRNRKTSQKTLQSVFFWAHVKLLAWYYFHILGLWLTFCAIPVLTQKKNIYISVLDLSLSTSKFLIFQTERLNHRASFRGSRYHQALWCSIDFEWMSPHNFFPPRFIPWNITHTNNDNI